MMPAIALQMSALEDLVHGGHLHPLIAWQLLDLPPRTIERFLFRVYRWAPRESV